MGKRRAKSLELLTSDQVAAAPPPQAPRKRGRPRKVIIQVKEIAEPEGEREPDGEKSGVRGGEEQQQQQEHDDGSPPPAAGKEEKFILKPTTQDEEKPSSSRGRRKNQKPRKST